MPFEEKNWIIFGIKKFKILAKVFSAFKYLIWWHRKCSLLFLLGYNWSKCWHASNVNLKFRAVFKFYDFKLLKGQRVLSILIRLRSVMGRLLKMAPCLIITTSAMQCHFEKSLHYRSRRCIDGFFWPRKVSFQARLSKKMKQE